MRGEEGQRPPANLRALAAGSRTGRVCLVAAPPTDPTEPFGFPGGAGGAPPADPDGDHLDRRDRRRALARLVAIVAVVALAAVFIVQNLHPVTVHLWLVQRRLGLVWIIAGCLVVGLAVGYWVGWQGHRQAAQRRAERAARGGRWRRSE